MSADALVPIAVAFMAAIPPTLVATAALVTVLRQQHTLTETHAEVGKVHTLVNSQMTTLKADLAIAQQQIEQLLARIEALKT